MRCVPSPLCTRTNKEPPKSSWKTLGLLWSPSRHLHHQDVSGHSVHHGPCSREMLFPWGHWFSLDRGNTCSLFKPH